MPQFHIAQYKFVQGGDGHLGGKEPTALPIISDMQNYDTGSEAEVVGVWGIRKFKKFLIKLS